jgi:hypothetical protein
VSVDVDRGVSASGSADPWSGWLASRPAAPALLGLLALVAVLFWPVLFQGRVFYHRDIHLQWQPHMEAAVGAVAAGSWPLWNTSVAFGQPLLANPNTQLLYPTTWLNLFLQPWTSYTILVVAHVLLAAAGTYLLGRRYGISRTGAFVAAAAWVAGGPFLSLADLWNHLCGAAWIPWAALAAERVAAEGRARDALLWGASIAAPVLAGSPEAALMAALGSVCLALAGHARRLIASGRALRVLALSLAAAAYAILLSAGQWMPSLELAQRSVRTALPDALRTYWSLHPFGLLEMLFPTFLHRLPLHWEIRGTLFEHREPFFASVYLGLGTWALVAAALTRPRDPRRAVLLGLVALTVVFALGRHAFLYDVAMQLVPALRTLRFPSKLLILASFAWALLAGLGIDEWRQGGRRTMTTIAAVLLIALVTAISLGALARYGAEAWGSALLSRGQRLESFTELLRPIQGRAVQAAVVALALLALWPKRVRVRLGEPILAALVAAIVVADLAAAHRTLHPTATPDLFLYRPPAVQVVRPAAGQRVFVYDYFVAGKSAQYLGHRGSYRTRVPEENWPFRHFEALALRDVLFPSVIGTWGLEAGYTIDPLNLFPPELQALTALLHRAEGTPAHRRLLQLGAIGTVAALHREGFEGLLPVATLPTLMAEPLHVFHVPDALPRAFAVSGVRMAEGRDALRLLVDPAFDPHREVVLAGDVSPAPAAPGVTGQVRVVRHAPDEVQIEAELNGPGYVVLLDGYDPGWNATIDGRPTRVLRANTAFRAVAVAPGRHAITFRYRPSAVVRGMALSLLAVLLGAVVAVRVRR